MRTCCKISSVKRSPSEVRVGFFGLLAHVLMFSSVIFLPSVYANVNDNMLNFVAEPATIGFVEAMRLALEQNDRLKITEQGILIAEGDALSAASQLLPKISLKASHFTTSKDKTTNIDDNATASLSAIVPLLDGKALIDLKAKRELAASAREQYQSARDALLNEVGALYIEAAIARSSSDNAYEEQELYKQQLSIFERKSKVGAARSLDIRRAQYLVAKVYSDYILKRQDYLKKMGELGNKIGVNDFFLLGPVVIDSPHLKKTASELREIANSSADVKAINQEISAAQFAITGEKFDFVPKFNATVDAGWQVPTAGNILMPDQRALFVKMMFNVELPLFSGGATWAAIKANTAKKTIQDVNLRSKLTDKYLGINALFEQLKGLEVAKANAELAVLAAALAKESAERMFDNNEATGLELVEANTNHFTAKNLLVSTTLRLEHAKLKLLFLIGRVKEIL